MRKTFFLLTALVVVALALVIALRSLSGRGHGDPLAPTAALPESDAGASILDRTTDLNRPDPGTSGTSRSTVVDTTAAERVGSRLECALRVHVLMPPGVVELPRGLDVQVSNQLGVVYDAHLDGDEHYLVRDLHPGTFVVVAKAPGWRRVWKSVSVQARPTEDASVDMRQTETVVELVLQPVHRIRVRWRTPEGRPVLEGLGSAALSTGPAGTFEELEARTTANGTPISAEPEVRRTSLSVHATQSVPPLIGPMPDGLSLASWSLYAVVSRDANGKQTASAAPWLASRGAPIDPNPQTDSFAMLELDEDGPVFVSVWRDLVRLDMVHVAADQEEVVFTTSAQALDVPTVPVTARIVDARTGMPLAGASLRTSLNSSATANDEGVAKLSTPMGRIQFTMTADEHEPMTVYRVIEHESPVDLGVVRLHSSAGDALEGFAYAVSFRVKNAAGGGIEGTALELVRLSSYDGTGNPSDVTTGFAGRISLPGGGLVSPSSSSSIRLEVGETGRIAFAVRELDRYVLRSAMPAIDIEPRIVPTTAFTKCNGITPSGGPIPLPEPLADDIVVHAPKVVCFRFDDPPRRGTRIAIETTDGLPVRILDTNDFGIVQTWLGARAYRLHLIENGEATSSLDFHVDRDPFVLEIAR